MVNINLRPSSNMIVKQIKIDYDVDPNPNINRNISASVTKLHHKRVFSENADSG